MLRDRIIQLGAEVGFQDKWLRRILRHAISEFSKKGLGPDYYGYHNIDHELEAAYFTLLSASSPKPGHFSFSQQDLTYLFVAALFHDYDPQKRFDKPHEDAVERIVRGDVKIVRFIDEVGLNIDLVLALVHRTAYPFRGAIAEHALARMDELFDSAGLAPEDAAARKHYSDMGWYLSVAERVAGYALGDFQHALDLARKNAHALGWHPSVINERSVQYFASLAQEGEMLERVLAGLPERYERAFVSNSEAFKNAWMEEVELKRILSDKIKMTATVEGVPNSVGSPGRSIPDAIKSVVSRIYSEQALPIKVADVEFHRSLSDERTILITLRVDKGDGQVEIVGYAKGYPLENAELRRGTEDANIGERNTAYLEGIGIRKGFWGASGGHLLRLRFLSEASNRGYKFVSGYAHREVILQRVKKGEKIAIVQKYDPDMLDYYREDLTDELCQTILGNTETMYVSQR